MVNVEVKKRMIDEYGIKEFSQIRFGWLRERDGVFEGDFVATYVLHNNEEHLVGINQDPVFALVSIDDAFGIESIEKDEYGELVIKTKKGFCVKCILQSMNQMQDCVVLT